MNLVTLDRIAETAALAYARAGKHMRAAVFVVDDQIEQARALQKLMSKMGHDVVIETNAQKALEILLGPSTFDVTFLDLLMPDLNGLEIINVLALKAPARLRRVVLLTGLAYMAPEQYFAKAGVLLVEKPASDKILRHTITQYAEMDAPRGPSYDDGFKEIESMPRLPQPSHPELPALYDDEMDVDTGTIEIASKLNLPASAMTELRFRHLHRKHDVLVAVVGDIKVEVVDTKKDITELKAFSSEIKTTVKTSAKWVATVVVLAGAAWQILEHVVFKP